MFLKKKKAADESVLDKLGVKKDFRKIREQKEDALRQQVQ
jgi:hypothetical protein